MTVKTSSIDSREMGLTVAPMWGVLVTSPSDWRSCRPSRTGIALTSSWRARSSITRRAPGAQLAAHDRVAQGAVHELLLGAVAARGSAREREAASRSSQHDPRLLLDRLVGGQAGPGRADGLVGPAARAGAPTRTAAQNSEIS